MKNITAIEVRIELLRSRDAIGNARIITKLERKKRALIKAGN
jgi:hypothetical protein